MASMLHLPRASVTTALTLCAITALGVGCAGRSIDEGPEPGDTVGDGRDVTSATSEGSSPQTSEDGPSAAPEQAAAREACQRQPQGNRSTPREDDFRQLLIGSWLLCDSASVFGTTDEAGLVLHADFTWQKLLRDDDGNLVASSSWEQSGRWETVDTSDMNGSGSFQLNIDIDGSGTIYTHPVFANQPDVMRLNNMGVVIADYARF